MQLVLTEDQELIAKTAADFVAEKSPISRVRELRDSADEVGFSRALWKEMADLGWVGIPFAEEHGGAGLGLAELAPVLEALGQNLAPEPFLSSVLLGGQALALSGDEARCKEWLPAVASGDKLLTLAYQGPKSRYDLDAPGVTADADGGAFRLTGESVQVLDGHVADAILVSAQAPGGLGLFWVERGASGLETVRQHRVDGRGAALLRFAGVSAEAVVQPGAATPVIEAAVDRATVGLCAEMLGAMQQAFDLTLEHLKQREQFETVIGTFQALKHRAADVFIDIELARSAVMAAARAVDAGADDAAKLVSLAKARCSDTFVLAANEGVQMFGGVGMTDEYDIGFYMKRARAAEMTFGDAAHHRQRWARLSGY